MFVNFVIFLLVLSTVSSLQEPELKEKPDVLKLVKEGVKENELSQEKKIVKIWGLEFVTYPTHYQLSIWDPNESDYYQKFLSSVHGTFLEIGSGPGHYSVRAALNGASKVVAVDINEEAVKNTLENAKKHGLTDDTFEAFQSDIFNNPKLKGLKFDTIFWQLPFVYLDPSKIEDKELTTVEKGIYDPGYKSLHRFLKEASHYLSNNGKLYISWSRELGNEDYLNYVIRLYNWKKSLYEEAGTSGVTGNPSIQLWELQYLGKRIEL